MGDKVAEATKGCAAVTRERAVEQVDVPFEGPGGDFLVRQPALRLFEVERRSLPYGPALSVEPPDVSAPFVAGGRVDALLVALSPLASVAAEVQVGRHAYGGAVVDFVAAFCHGEQHAAKGLAEGRLSE